MIRLVILIAISLVIGGCASPARIDQMTVYSPVGKTNPALKDGIAVTDVTGGRETSAMWTSQVSSDDFRRALETSLQNAGLYNRVAGASRFQLTADLTRLDQPMLGLDMTVTSTVRYSLVDTKTRKEVYGRVIQMPFTAKFSDAFAGVERLKIANEGSVRANIQAVIDDLIALKLP